MLSRNLPIALLIIAMCCLVILLGIAVASYVNRERTRRAKGVGRGGYVFVTLPSWVTVFAWIVGIAMVLSFCASLFTSMYRHERVPSSETGTVIMPVITTDSGERVLQLTERHGYIIAWPCKATECDGLSANSQVVFDTFYDSSGKRVYQNLHKA